MIRMEEIAMCTRLKSIRSVCPLLIPTLPAQIIQIYLRVNAYNIQMGSPKQHITINKLLI